MSCGMEPEPVGVDPAQDVSDGYLDYPFEWEEYIDNRITLEGETIDVEIDMERWLQQASIWEGFSDFGEEGD